MSDICSDCSDQLNVCNLCIVKMYEIGEMEWKKGEFHLKYDMSKKFQGLESKDRANLLLTK